MTETRELYRVERLPIFQNRMYDSRDAARDCQRGDVVLVENLDTGLVYNKAFKPELMDYDANYQNEQGVSPLFRRHLEYVADLVQQHMGRVDIVEVGCGKGLFLEMLAARDVDILGFDPTYEGTNPRVQKEYFHRGLEIRAEGLILRHVLEHIPDPVSFLQDLSEANGGRGKIYIEVPCFDWICEHRAWFDVFYEHVNYFRLTDFLRIFGRVHVAERSFGGQYLSIVGDLATIRRPARDPSDPVAFPQDFARDLRPRNLNRSVVWGGASKGVLFALMMERAGVNVDMVVDINPAKQGRYLPGTGVRVAAPEAVLAQLPDLTTIYVMNSNYLPEIREMSGNRFSYVGIDNG